TTRPSRNRCGGARPWNASSASRSRGERPVARGRESSTSSQPVAISLVTTEQAAARRRRGSRRRHRVIAVGGGIVVVAGGGIIAAVAIRVIVGLPGGNHGAVVGDGSAGGHDGGAGLNLRAAGRHDGAGSGHRHGERHVAGHHAGVSAGISAAAARLLNRWRAAVIALLPLAFAEGLSVRVADRRREQSQHADCRHFAKVHRGTLLVASVTWNGKGRRTCAGAGSSRRESPPACWQVQLACPVLAGKWEMAARAPLRGVRLAAKLSLLSL